jgi:hypothetical protein
MKLRQYVLSIPTGSGILQVGPFNVGSALVAYGDRTGQDVLEGFRKGVVIPIS